MDILGRRNGAEKRKWTSGESQVNSIHNVGFIISYCASHCKLQPERERERERMNDYDKEISMPLNSDSLLMKT